MLKEILKKKHLNGENHLNPSGHGEGRWEVADHGMEISSLLIHQLVLLDWEELIEELNLLQTINHGEEQQPTHDHGGSLLGIQMGKCRFIIEKNTCHPNHFHIGKFPSYFHI